MWEHFTTKPLVDNKIFRRLGDCPTPWPCFVIAVRDEILETNKEQIKDILEVINNTTSDFKQIPNIDTKLSHRYEQQLEDIREWLEITEWSQTQLSNNILQKVQKQLFNLDIINKIIPENNLISQI